MFVKTKIHVTLREILYFFSFWEHYTRHHSAEQGREAPEERPVTLFGLDIGPVTCHGVTVFIHDGFFDHVNFD